MPGDTVTLALEGDVLLSEFARGVAQLSALVEALSDELASDAKIEWQIDDLQAGSTMATARGVSVIPEAVSQVIEAYARLGASLEARQPLLCGERAKRAASSIVKLLDGHVRSIRFETAVSESIVATAALYGGTAKGIQFSLGSLTGQVQTLSNRGRLRFTLYDALFDHAISCYLDPGQEEIMRNAWGRRVTVSGEIGREPERGRPVVVRHIRSVGVETPVAPGSYKAARGALQGAIAERSEELVRRVRDAE
jgi:hypothetical protein